jgi:hypothetical protein
MSLWLLPIIGLPGLLVYRAWRSEVAMRSGELMDVRDVMPTGEADMELRALGGRWYRLELQFEACLSEPGPAGAILPYRLSVERSDGAMLYERERALSELFRLASSADESVGQGDARRAQARYWGSVPLLDFRSDSLGRLRFDFSIESAAPQARLEKAQLVLKEDVRRLSLRAPLLDRVEIQAEVGRAL